MRVNKAWKEKETNEIFLRNREKDGGMETKHIVLMMVRIVLGKRVILNIFYNSTEFFDLLRCRGQTVHLWLLDVCDQ